MWLVWLNYILWTARIFTEIFVALILLSCVIFWTNTSDGLQVLGSGFEVFAVGKRKLVRSVPTELNKDHNEILELAQVMPILLFSSASQCSS